MADKFPALTGRASDTQLLDHLQWLIEQRGEHGSTSAISLGYEENGPRIELYHGEKQWFATWRADGTDVRSTLVASLKAVRMSSKRAKKTSKSAGRADGGSE